ncbi:MAG: hypothetical protein LBQ54_02320 [Planctomycetaceae bacterium]|jgi:hypothetical protein|nr:hypothetical protein [Planctomycetaceae bacterium]
MTIDPYLPCPGGRNKKIRFCCPEMLRELEQIHKFLEDDQFHACFSYIEDVEKKHPDCACLDAAKLEILKSQGRLEEMVPIAEKFYNREPDNHTAVADLALALAAGGDPDRAISLLVDAYEQEKEGEVHQMTLSNTQTICQILAQAGYPVSGLALAKVLLTFTQGSEEMAKFLRDMIAQIPLPLPVKTCRFNPLAPEGFAGKADYDRIAPLIVTGKWKKALAGLEKLAPQASEWPNLLLSLALVQLWLHKTEDAYATLLRYAAMDGITDEDRAEVMALYFMLDRRNIEDETKIVNRSVEINHFDAVLEQFLSTPDFYSVDFDPRAYGDAEHPAPKKIFMILDRPFPEDGTAPTLENTPRQIGTLSLFGRQTDREARLEVMEALETAQEEIMNRLREKIGGHITNVGEMKTVREVTEIAARIDSRLRFRSTNHPTKEQLLQLVDDSLKRDGPFWQWWLNHSFKILDGQTPKSAATNPSYRAKILGMIQMVEYLLPPAKALHYCNSVRESLGFEPLGTITLPEELPETALSRLPITRWFRVDTAPLPLESLGNELEMLDLVGEMRGAVHFAQEILARPMLEEDYAVRAYAFRVMLEDAEERDNEEDVSLWIDRAKNEAAALKQPLAEWEIAELLLRLRQRDSVRTTQLMEYIMRHYRNDPQVMMTMQQIFMQLGLVNPDGTPTHLATLRGRRPAPAAPDTAAESSSMTSGGISPEPSAAQPSKLWIPGMD